MAQVVNLHGRFRFAFVAVVATGLVGFCTGASAQIPKPVPTPSAKPEAQHAVAAEPNSTLASFGDWSLRCQRVGEGAGVQRLCEVGQQIRTKDQQNPVAELAVGRMKKNDPLRLTMVLPAHVTLSKLPTLSSDGKVAESLDIGWRKCLPGGCIADAVLKDDVLTRWRVQTNPGRINWTDGAGRDLEIGLSFRGLAQALDALSKEP